MIAQHLPQLTKVRRRQQPVIFLGQLTNDQFPDVRIVIDDQHGGGTGGGGIGHPPSLACHAAKVCPAAIDDTG
ncbi:hypothetical protein EBBID32_3200 [Sphingobium indicum BiD32]|uniref:Uncharacterized protein n=1 Tax=Sphingobium indicum BiD32 TaxID=1301087 RepID=N1MGT1_9SPHN|nr:hypothetical protein EBBID32_3200 [Sphingobium indicum BiD32]